MAAYHSERPERTPQGNALPHQTGSGIIERTQWCKGLWGHHYNSAAYAQASSTSYKTAYKKRPLVLQTRSCQRRFSCTCSSPARSQVPLLGQCWPWSNIHEHPNRASKHRKRNHQEAHWVHNGGYTPARHTQPSARGRVETKEPWSKTEKRSASNRYLHPNAYW